MSSTNRTANYQLPQFVNTDKPTWLGDVNSAMANIDTNLKSVSDTATNALDTANAAATAGDLNNVQVNVTSLQETVSAIQNDLQKIRVYDGEYITGTLAGNATHTVTVTLPSNARAVLAVIPFGYDPSANWSTMAVFDTARTDGTVRLRTVGSTNQYYSIKYKVIYTVD